MLFIIIIYRTLAKGMREEGHVGEIIHPLQSVLADNRMVKQIHNLSSN